MNGRQVFSLGGRNHETYSSLMTLLSAVKVKNWCAFAHTETKHHMSILDWKISAEGIAMIDLPRAPKTLLLLAGIVVAAPLLTVPALAQDQAPLATSDPRAKDPEFQRMQRLFGGVRDILEDAAIARESTRTESSSETLLTRPFGLDARSRADRLLADAFEVVSDAPVTEIQKEIRERRAASTRLREQIARLREDRISAPEDAGISGTLGLAADRAGIDADIDEAQARIAGNEMAVRVAKDRFREAMAKSGAPVSEEEADLLLDSVTGSDIVKMASAYRAARGVSSQLLSLLDESGEDLTVAKRYYAMHTALLALLVHAQGSFIERVDSEYLPKLDAIERDILAARKESEKLIRGERDSRRRGALEANIESQRIAMEAGAFYRQHLKSQRAEVEQARQTALRELQIADNTLRTVDASFQLRSMMENATISFEALQSLESPGIERFFRNEQLRREFRELSDKLNAGS